MIETGLFGLNQGSFMVNYGGTNTQQAAPFILSKMVTTQALFSTGMLEVSGTGIPPINNGATIASLMPATSPKQNSSNSFQYGLNDKYMLKDSIKYLERLQQPFYTKFITVSNHYPYTTSLSGDDLGFPLAKTRTETINGYFATANYLDSSIKAFFDYLKNLVFTKIPSSFSMGTTTEFQTPATQLLPLYLVRTLKRGQAMTMPCCNAFLIW